jgi:hypothetical protein
MFIDKPEIDRVSSSSEKKAILKRDSLFFQKENSKNP